MLSSQWLGLLFSLSDVVCDHRKLNWVVISVLRACSKEANALSNKDCFFMRAILMRAIWEAGKAMGENKERLNGIDLNC